MVTRSRPGGARRFASLVTVLTAFTTLSLVSGCDKVPLLAPSGTVITLIPTANTVPVNGSIEIVATLIESGVTTTPSTGTGGSGTSTSGQAGAGTPVHNGTLVTFTTTLGRIEPSEARTQNGQVRVRFIATGQSGLATITAFSGGASAQIEGLPVGAAAAERISITTTRSLGPAGGTTDVIARVEDESGSPLSGIPVSFRTTAGQLSQTTVITGQDGTATTQLTTNTNATVTATAGSHSSDVDVNLGARLINSVTASPQNVQTGQPVTLTIQANDAANISDATIDWGDGEVTRIQGGFSGSTTRQHVYSSTGSFTIEVTARDTLGNSGTGSTSVTVGALAVTLGVDDSSPTVNQQVTFTATAPNGTQVREYRWNFGDGTTTTTSGREASHAYSRTGNFTARVDVIGINGNVIGSGQRGVTVTSS